MFSHGVFGVHDVLHEPQSEHSQPSCKCQTIRNHELILHALGSGAILKLPY